MYKICRLVRSSKGVLKPLKSLPTRAQGDFRDAMFIIPNIPNSSRILPEKLRLMISISVEWMEYKQQWPRSICKRTDMATILAICKTFQWSLSYPTTYLKGHFLLNFCTSTEKLLRLNLHGVSYLKGREVIRVSTHSPRSKHLGDFFILFCAAFTCPLALPSGVLIPSAGDLLEL